MRALTPARVASDAERASLVRPPRLSCGAASMSQASTISRSARAQRCDSCKPARIDMQPRRHSPGGAPAHPASPASFLTLRERPNPNTGQSARPRATHCHRYAVARHRAGDQPTGVAAWARLTRSRATGSTSRMHRRPCDRGFSRATPKVSAKGPLPNVVGGAADGCTTNAPTTRDAIANRRTRASQ